MFCGSLVVRPVCPAAPVCPLAVLPTRGTLQSVGDQQTYPHNTSYILSLLHPFGLHIYKLIRAPACYPFFLFFFYTDHTLHLDQITSFILHNSHHTHSKPIHSPCLSPVTLSLTHTPTHHTSKKLSRHVFFKNVTPPL